MQRLGRFRDSIAPCEAALQLDPENSKALFRKGSAEKHEGDLEAAKASLTAACKADPKSREAREQLKETKAML